MDPTGHFPLISWDRFVGSVNAYKKNQRELNIWVGEDHTEPQGNYLTINLNAAIKFKNFIKEGTNVGIDARPYKHSETIRAKYTQDFIQILYPKLTSEKIKELAHAKMSVMMLAITLNTDFIGRDHWRDKEEYERMRKMGSLKGSSLFLVGAAHTLTNIRINEDKNPKAFPAFKHMDADSSIAVTLKSTIDKRGALMDERRTPTTPDFGVWIESEEGTFLVHGAKSVMRKIFGNIIEEVPTKLAGLSAPVPVPPTPQNTHCVIL
jgi:hypothetical protein